MDEPARPPLRLESVIIPTLSGIVLALDILPLLWHIRKRNLAASSIIFWIIVLNAMGFLNPLVWPRDDVDKWWLGYGLCDVEIRLQVAALIAVPGAITCIMWELATVLNPNHGLGSSSVTWQRIQTAIKITLCVGLPVWYMIAYIFVQPVRYGIVTTKGCSLYLDQSWLTVAIILIWPPIFSFCNAVFAALVLYRLYVHRQQTMNLLPANSATRSRFFRLFMISILAIFALLPFQLFTTITFVADGLIPYSWSRMRKNWHLIPLTPLGGPGIDAEVSQQQYSYFIGDRILWVICGLLVFVFLGTGKDATAEYQMLWKNAGLGTLFKRSKTSCASAQYTHDSPATTSSSSTWTDLLHKITPSTLLPKHGLHIAEEWSWRKSGRQRRASSYHEVIWMDSDRSTKRCSQGSEDTIRHKPTLTFLQFLANRKRSAAEDEEIAANRSRLTVSVHDSRSKNVGQRGPGGIATISGETPV